MMYILMYDFVLPDREAISDLDAKMKEERKQTGEKVGKL